LVRPVVEVSLLSDNAVDKEVVNRLVGCGEMMEIVDDDEEVPFVVALVGGGGIT
jgi:hypothetical protein